MAALSVDTPMSLWQQCLDYCVQHPHTLCHKTRPHGPCVLHEWLCLPLDVCQSLLEACYEHDLRLDDRMLHIFADTERTQLTSLILRDSLVTDSQLARLLQHNISKLDLSGCVNLTSAVIPLINQYCSNLRLLYIGGHSLVLENWECEHSHSQGDRPTEDSHTVLECPHLEVLSIHDLKASPDTREKSVPKLICGLLSPLQSLSQLDLSGCDLDLENFQHLHNFPRLKALSLHAVELTSLCDAFEHIGKIKSLRCLDVSQSQESPVMYAQPEENLALLVKSLPHLSQLDLSGTNLAGFKPPEGLDVSKDAECPIPGLEERQFEFLGLLGCAHQACERKRIPAKRVAGSSSEIQILVAVKRYVDRPQLLVKALNHLFHILRFFECSDQRTALEGILCGMKRHPSDNHIQISGSASLFYIMKNIKHRLETSYKRRVIRALLQAMDRHMRESTVLRNGCLTLCQFRIPYDVQFASDRMVSILLRMVLPPVQEEFVQRIGIYLLNSLACQVEGSEKQLIGDKGAIETMLKVIEHKLEASQNDEVLEIAWSTMWNVTDETPSNCKRFLDGDGMEYFLRCLQVFPDHEELLRNMMGLMGNVAEVASLRHQLMKPQYVQIFTDLLDSGSDGIEVSYNACGVLSHMTANADSSWPFEEPRRSTVLSKMSKAIHRWDLKTKRNINYRSFEPILRLVPLHETPQAQLWAIWALCNLTKMYRKKYCPLVEAEGGLELLRGVIEQKLAYQETQDLAQQVLERCARFHTDPGYDSSDDPQDEAEHDHLDG